MKRRLFAVLATVALMFGLGAAAAHHAHAATAGATGPIVGYQGLCDTGAQITSFA